MEGRGDEGDKREEVKVGNVIRAMFTSFLNINSSNVLQRGEGKGARDMKKRRQRSGGGRRDEKKE